MKIIATAVVTFETDLDDGDPTLIPADQAYEAILIALPTGFDLEEIVEWTPKTEVAS